MVDDVRTRKLVQPIIAKEVLDDSKPVEFKAGNIFKQASKTISAQDKADAEANKFFLESQEIEYDKIAINRRMQIANTTGLKAIEMHRAHEKELRQIRDDIISKARPDLKDQLRGRLDKVLMGYQKVGINKLYKETENAKIESKKAIVQKTSRDAILESHDFATYRDIVDNQLDTSNDDLNSFSGLPKEKADILKFDSRSKTHLDAIEYQVNTFGSVGAEDFFNKVKSELNGDDLDSAKDMLKKAKTKDDDLEVQRFVSQALNQKNPRNAIAILNSARPEIRHKVRSQYRTANEIRKDGEKQIKADKKIEAYDMVQSSNGLRLQEAKALVDPKEFKELENFALYTRKGKWIPNIEGDLKFEELYELSYRDPEAYIRESGDLMSRRGAIHPSKLEKLVRRRNEALKGRTSLRQRRLNETSTKISVSAKEILRQAGIRPGKSKKRTQEFSSAMNVARDLWDSVVEEHGETKNVREMQAIWRDDFQVRAIELPREFEGFFGESGLNLSPFHSEALSFKVFKGDESLITRDEALKRLNDNELILPIKNADPAFLDRIKKDYKDLRQRSGLDEKELDDDELQELVENTVQDLLLLEKKQEGTLEEQKEKESRRESDRKRREAEISKETPQRGTF